MFLRVRWYLWVMGGDCLSLSHCSSASSSRSESPQGTLCYVVQSCGQHSALPCPRNAGLSPSLSTAGFVCMISITFCGGASFLLNGKGIWSWLCFTDFSFPSLAWPLGTTCSRAWVVSPQESETHCQPQMRLTIPLKCSVTNGAAAWGAGPIAAALSLPGKLSVSVADPREKRLKGRCMPTFCILGTHRMLIHDTEICFPVGRWLTC